MKIKNIGFRKFQVLIGGESKDFLPSIEIEIDKVQGELLSVSFPQEIKIIEEVKPVHVHVEKKGKK